MIEFIPRRQFNMIRCAFPAPSPGRTCARSGGLKTRSGAWSWPGQEWIAYAGTGSGIRHNYPVYKCRSYAKLSGPHAEDKAARRGLYSVPVRTEDVEITR